MKIAYLTNRFPCAVEPYVMEEIIALRASGIEVLASSARRPGALSPDLKKWGVETLYLQAWHARSFIRSLFRCLRLWRELRPFIARIGSGDESFWQRAKAMVQTWLGVYYSVLLEKENIQHIHAHHGYFSSWIAMVAARLLGISYSLTLHGSDLLVKAAYLDVKLEHCLVCFTISEYNRSVIYRRYPRIAREKIRLRRMGVDVPPTVSSEPERVSDRFLMLAAGRLHQSKIIHFLYKRARF